MRRALERQLAQLWHVEDVLYAFQVTQMTLWHWRQERGFPTFNLGRRRDSLRFIPQEVREWARLNNQPFREPAGRRKSKRELELLMTAA